MTTATTQGFEGDALIDPVGDSLVAISGALQVHCLLETSAQRVLTHQTCSAALPPQLVDALLTRDLGRVADALHGRTLSGRGRRVDARLADWSGTVSIVDVGSTWLWLMGERVLDDACVTWAVEMVEQAASRATSAPGELARALRGLEPLRPDVLPTGPTFLVALSAPTTSALPVPHRTAVVDGCSYLLVVARTEALVRRQVGRLLASGQVAVVSACTAQDLTATRAGLDEALTLPVPTGQCFSLSAVAPALMVLRAAAALNGPALVPDPLGALSAQDGRSDEVLAQTLLAWLDAHGDIAGTAAALGLHGNTVRYRINRARTLLGPHLDDPDERLVLHLRLLQRFPRVRLAPEAVLTAGPLSKEAR